MRLYLVLCCLAACFAAPVPTPMWSGIPWPASFEQAINGVIDASRQLDLSNTPEHSGMHRLTESLSMPLRRPPSFTYESYPLHDHVVQQTASAMLQHDNSMGMVDLDYLLQPSGLNLKLDTSSIAPLFGHPSTSSSTTHGNDISLSAEALPYHSALSSSVSPPVARPEDRLQIIHNAPGQLRGTEEMTHTTHAIANVALPFPLTFDLPSQYVWAPSIQLKTELLSKFQSQYLLSPDQFTDLSYTRLAGEPLPWLMKQPSLYFRPRSHVFAYKLSGHGVLVKFHNVGSIKEGHQNEAALSLWTIERGLAASSVLSGRGVLGVDPSVVATLRHSFGKGTYIVSDASPLRNGKKLILKDFN